VSAPLVSVCLPTYNSAGFVAEALESALAQTYEPLEVLVVDNGSTDGTLELVRGYDDPRLRVSVNERNIGLVANHNQCIRLARGELVKFLHSDDVLYPDAVARLADVAARSAQVGLVFARRRVLLDESDAAARAWGERYATLHEPFGPLADVSPGRPLFDRWLAGVLREPDAENWIGEPTSVLVRRDAFARVGLFNDRLSQLVDVEMWLRLLFFFDLGFVDEELSGYRHHTQSVSAAHAGNGKSWLERLWLIEGLLEHPEIAAAHPELRRARLQEAPLAARRAAGRLAHRRPFLGPAGEYVGFLARRRRPSLHDRLG
jgi:glycosyltransferase involved in cell wall biosynthesis